MNPYPLGQPYGEADEAQQKATFQGISEHFMELRVANLWVQGVPSLNLGVPTNKKWSIPDAWVTLQRLRGQNETFQNGGVNWRVTS